MGTLEIMGSKIPRCILLNDWIYQVAMPEFTGEKHSQGKACCVCTA